MKTQSTLMIVDDTPSNIEVLIEELSDKGFKLLVAEDGESALTQVEAASPDLILLDLMMPGIDGIETCRRLKTNPITKEIPVIFMTSHTDITHKVFGFDVGAVDYVTKPFDPKEILARVKTHLTIKTLRDQLLKTNQELERRVEERTQKLKVAMEQLQSLKNRLQAENVYLQEEIKRDHNFEEIISKSKAFKKILTKIKQVANTDATVLILGETGTGKELIARAIHNSSDRADRPLVKVNCASLPGNLIESELFGHEKGAFTGAISQKIGRFEFSDGGTLFLDEIGDLPLELQAKLLRVLQEGELERLGGAETITVDVRIIAATNRDLKKAMQRGVFREDLFYRLNVFPIFVIPLRERKEDIPPLVHHFLNYFNDKFGRKVKRVSTKVINKLVQYNWPGNVRELEHVIERAVILSSGTVLVVEEPLINQQDSDFSKNDYGNLQELERSHIVKTLKQCSWVVEGKRGAALILGLNPSTLRSRMKKLEIKKPSC